MTLLRFVAALIALLALVPAASAAATMHYDRTSFDAAVSAMLIPELTVNFDSVPAGTNIGGATLGPATFTAIGSPLFVVNQIPRAVSSDPGLPATTAGRVLSPGGDGGILACGEGLGIDNDDVRIDFSPAIHGAGIDVIFKSPDGASFVSFAFYDSFSNLIASDGFIPAPAGHPGYQFVGLTSTAEIKTIIIDEFDDTCFGSGAAGDEQVGYDTLVMTAPGAVLTQPTPELSTVLLFGVGLAAIAGVVILRRR